MMAVPWPPSLSSWNVLAVGSLTVNDWARPGLFAPISRTRLKLPSEAEL